MNSNYFDLIPTRISRSPSRRSNHVRMTLPLNVKASSERGFKRSNNVSLVRNASKQYSISENKSNELVSTSKNVKSDKLKKISMSTIKRMEEPIHMKPSGNKMPRSNMTTTSGLSSSTGLPSSMRSSHFDIASSSVSSKSESLPSRHSNSVRKTSQLPGQENINKASFSEHESKRSSASAYNPYKFKTRENDTKPEELKQKPSDSKEKVDNTVDMNASVKEISRSSMATPSRLSSGKALPSSKRSSRLDIPSSRRSSQFGLSSNSKTMTSPVSKSIKVPLREPKETSMVSFDKQSDTIASFSMEVEIKSEKHLPDVHDIIPRTRSSKRLNSARMISPIHEMTSAVHGLKSYNARIEKNASKRSLVPASILKELETNRVNAVPKELNIFIDRCKNIKNTAAQNVKKVEQNHAAVTAEIKKYRKQINGVLDLWEKEALKRVNDIMEWDIDNLNSVLDKCAHLAEEILQLSDEVTEYKTKLLEVNVIETEAKNTYREYKFIHNENISNLLKAETRIGNVEITHEVAGLYNDVKRFDNFVPTYLDEINVKAENDTFDCDITGMAMLSTNKLVVADTDNKSIKIVNTKLKKIISQLNFSSGPWDLTVVNRGQVAVTIPSEKVIQFVLTSPSLVTGRYLKVNGDCHGITYSKECLIVTFRSPGKVQIISLQGNVLKSIHQFVYRTKVHIFDWPDYVAVSKDGNSIYVSDWHRNTVTRLSWKGEVIGVYKDNIGTKMAGVAVANDGSVFACKRTSHSIIKLSPDCSVSSTILEEKHGLKYPWSLCFCDEESKLYVDNNRNSNSVAVFELR